ncbi:GTP-binding protein HflX [Thermotomaculum hydrothermale]|uniref:GTPase HflX n=1 Tax=Thermotomaculum hydrothermale TaxID=981385 RepID=A0A7R6PTU5_9BACT|nr:GTPase HflX [Thermotomaculum hydrothermale]BBB32547.1 GTP-binding protein HflX [Thermotomaculum hydrothermale]
MRKAIIVEAKTPDTDKITLKLHLEELERLLNSLNIEVVKKAIQNRYKIHPATYVGEGFLSALETKDIDYIAFDNKLSPSQKRNIKRITGLTPIDRENVILQIFKNHAKTKEAKIQVELAELKTILSELKGRKTNLAQQVGAIGVKGGKGEKQIELDRRKIQKRIAFLKRELKKIESRKEHIHKSRENIFKISIAGYTNAGKSTLLNTLTKANVSAKDKLFMTLDTTTRKLHLYENRYAVLSDTVGFIRKLPHHLVASFKSTFAVITYSDLIIQLVDITSNNFEEEIEVVHKELQKECEKIPKLLIFNKIDLTNKMHLDRVKALYPHAIFISAKEKLNIEELKEAILIYYKKWKNLSS